VNLQTLYDLLDLMCIYGISAVAQNLLVGYGGIPAVAPTGFGACGGYLAAYLALHEGWPTLASLVVGIIAACAVGFVMSVLAMRLSVEYIILITIAFAVIVIDVFSNFGPFGGSVGLVGLPPLSIGITLGTTAALLPLLIAVLLTTYESDGEQVSVAAPFTEVTVDAGNGPELLDEIWWALDERFRIAAAVADPVRGARSALTRA